MTIASVPLADLRIAPATTSDAAELVVLQRCCWVQEAVVNSTFDIPALHETGADVLDWLGTWSVWCVRRDGRLVAGVRAQLDGDTWEIGRLMVAPDLTGRGVGRWLLGWAESQAPREPVRFGLFTGARSTRNISLYERSGYRIVPQSFVAPGHIAGAVRLVEERVDP